MQTINETELVNIEGSRNKLVYKIGHYTGRVIDGIALGITIGSAF